MIHGGNKIICNQKFIFLLTILNVTQYSFTAAASAALPHFSWLTQEMIDYAKKFVHKDDSTHPPAFMFTLIGKISETMVDENYKDFEEILKIFTDNGSHTLNNMQLQIQILDIITTIIIILPQSDNPSFYLKFLRIFLRFVADSLESIKILKTFLLDSCCLSVSIPLRVNKAIEALTTLEKDYEKYLNYLKNHSELADVLLKIFPKGVDGIIFLLAKISSFEEFEEWEKLKEISK